MYHLKCISLETGAEIAMPDRTVLCLGNFDGVHLAHRELLRSALAWKETLGLDAAVGVFCFRELTAKYLDRDFEGQLCSLEARMERFRACGMEFVILADFSEVQNVSAEQYLSEILIGQCHAEAVACGFNHRFGKGGQGTVDLLEKYFEGRVFVQSPVVFEGARVSASRIRKLLQEGGAEEAATLLTLPYSITSPVLHGKTLGGKMGVPTANQCFAEGAVIPKRGVYITECEVDGVRYRGVSNVGVRPTVDDGETVNCETYLIDFSGDLYGRVLTVHFLKYLREEKRFEDLDLLRAQIAEDIRSARSFD